MYPLELPHGFDVVFNWVNPLSSKTEASIHTALVHSYDPVEHLLASGCKIPMNLLLFRPVNLGIYLCELDHEPR